MTALARKLAALASERQYSNGAQILPDANIDALGLDAQSSAMLSVLQAVDDTMLPRRLHFKGQDGAITCLAAHRRLTCIEKVEGSVRTTPGLIGKTLERDDAAMIDHSGLVFASLVEASGSLTLQRSMSDLPAQSDAGVGIADLARAWDVDLDAKPKPVEDRYLAACGDALKGFAYMRQGEEAQIGGISDALMDGLEGGWSDRAGAYESADFLALPGILDNGLLMVEARLGETGVLSALSPAGLGQAHAAWMQLR